MTEFKGSSRRLVYLLVVVMVAIGVIVGAAIFKTTGGNKHDHSLALADKSASNDSVRLCSPYANLCFDRPTDWTRSKVLHVNGSADNTIEINPPSGTIMAFAISSKDTAIRCDKAAYKECIVKVSNIDTIKNNLSVVTGTLIASPDANCSKDCTTPQYTPFVQLVSADDLQAYKLKNDTSSFDEFNPSARVNNGHDVSFRVTPGKGYSINDATKWLDSPEAKTAQQILSSTTVYK